MTEYKFEEAIDAVKHSFGISKEKEAIELKPQRMRNFRNAGIHNEVQSILIKYHGSHEYLLLDCRMFEAIDKDQISNVN